MKGSKRRRYRERNGVKPTRKICRGEPMGLSIPQGGPTDREQDGGRFIIGGAKVGEVGRVI